MRQEKNKTNYNLNTWPIHTSNQSHNWNSQPQALQWTGKINLCSLLFETNITIWTFWGFYLELKVNLWYSEMVSHDQTFRSFSSHQIKCIVWCISLPQNSKNCGQKTTHVYTPLTHNPDFVQAEFHYCSVSRDRKSLEIWLLNHS
jgi:hypothetical protein